MHVQMRVLMNGNRSGSHKVVMKFSFFPNPLHPYLSFLLSLSEDEAFELCLGLQTLLELKVRSSFALLIFSVPYRESFSGVFFF